MRTATRRKVFSRDALSGAGQPLERASTLPPEAYTDPAVYEREIDCILRKEWLCAGRVDQVREPGRYVTLDLLGDRLVIARDLAGDVRVLSRVCRHRAAELVSGAGRARAFRCPYHAWTYGLDGRLIGAPLMDRVEGFDKSTCGLPEIRSEVWQGWIFVNFDTGALPLGPRLQPLAALLENYRVSDMVAIETAVLDSPFNWKVLVDNFMEAYHHIAIHKETLEPIFPATLSRVLDNDGPYSVLVMPGREGGPDAGDISHLPRHGTLDDWQRRSLVAAVVFPFHLFVPGADSLTWYQLFPKAPDCFTLRIHTCVPQATLDDPGCQEAIDELQEFTRLIHRQDIAACEAVWAGLTSRSVEAGRLSHLERSIWQFNQWWIARMVQPL